MSDAKVAGKVATPNVDEDESPVAFILRTVSDNVILTALHVNKATISRWRSGKRKPGPEHVAAMLELYEIQAADDDAPDLSDAEAKADDDEVRAQLARRGVTLPCAPADVLAAWARDPWPSATDDAPQAPAKPARELDGPRPDHEPPLHVFVRRAIHREVAEFGLEVATARQRSRGTPQWQIDEAMSLPPPPPRD